MEQYNPIKVEQKWRKEWQKKNNYEAKDKSKKPKLYILDFYPYPSGEGLHVGHVKGYIATDVSSRFKRMAGYNVLHPMGWDAFGLPAENYAIKTGVHPAQTTEKAIKNFKSQISALSLSYDWNREIGSHTPEYYKWTQWFFLLFYKNGLAYKNKANVNWDPVDQTVLANEQVLPDGTAERSGAKVVQKELEQWFFRITNFAQDLIDDLDKVDWPSHTIINQRNWIGKSIGAEIEFKVKCHSPSSDGVKMLNVKCDEVIKVFTTRPDTLFGATYIVFSPEHPIVNKIKDKIDNWKEVFSYIEKAKNKTEIDRTAEGKEKTGIELMGVKVINPASQEEIPIFIADYVLAHYGTGAIMAVPAHDERDFEFALRYNLPIRPVIVPDKNNDKPIEGAYMGEGVMINSGEFDGMPSSQAREKITKHVGGETKIIYKLRDWLISRQRYWGVPIPIVYDPSGKPHPVPEKHLPWKLPSDVEFKPEGYAPLAQSKELKRRVEKIFGKGWTPEVDTMDTFVCSSWYFFRFTDPKNKKEFANKNKIEDWMPVDLYVGGAEHTVLHLLYARFFTKVLHQLGYISFDEPFTRLRHVGMVGGADGRKMGKRYGNVVNPQDIVDSFGADTLRVYEMFMGPFEKGIDWQVDGIKGAHRFLGRVWGLVQKHRGQTARRRRASGGGLTPSIQEIEKIRHKTIKKVTEDIESMDYNTAISALMKYLNDLYEIEPTREDIRILLVLLAPFAPHITEELWQIMSDEKLDKNVSSFRFQVSSSIHEQEWPSYDEDLVKDEVIILPIQINGKLKAQIKVSQNVKDEEIESIVLSNEKIVKILADKEPKKIIIVKNKIVNIVI